MAKFALKLVVWEQVDVIIFRLEQCVYYDHYDKRTSARMISKRMAVGSEKTVEPVYEPKYRLEIF